MGDGIYLVDADYVRPRLAAIYIVEHQGRVAIIETGTNRSLPRVLDALDRLGLSVEDVDYVAPTHVHLDHAGGAGAMIDRFPNAKLVIHPRGRRHMIDPARLWLATIDVYGMDEATRLYGEITPVPADRVVEAADGLEISLSGRTLRFLDTPGHARHHCCIVDIATRGIFTGDLFGMSYPELDVEGRPSVMITTTPTQFDPVAMKASLDRLLALRPPALYLTHFSKVTDVDRLGAMLFGQLEAHVRVALEHSDLGGNERVTRITADLACYFQDERDRLGWRISDREFEQIVMPDVRLNAKGLDAWIEQEQVAKGVLK